MRKSDWIKLLCCIPVIIGIIWLSKIIFEAVYYSDLPAWVKYLLLHG